MSKLRSKIGSKKKKLTTTTAKRGSPKRASKSVNKSVSSHPRNKPNKMQTASTKEHQAVLRKTAKKSNILRKGEVPMSSNWEYKDYLFSFDPPKRLGTYGSVWTLDTYRNEVWSHTKSDLITHQLREWFDDGWEPVTELGPDCVVLETQDKRELGGGGALFGINSYVYLKEIRIPMRRHTRGSQSDVAGLIAKLAELRDAGILTEEEFATKKKALLGKI